MVGRGIDAGRGSKWIENDRNIGLRRSTYIRTYCTIVEIQRVGEKVRLSSIIERKAKFEILHRRIIVGEPRSSRKGARVKKPRVDDAIKLCLVNSTIIHSVEIRNCPRTGASGWCG